MTGASAGGSIRNSGAPAADLSQATRAERLFGGGALGEHDLARREARVDAERIGRAHLCRPSASTCADAGPA